MTEALSCAVKKNCQIFRDFSAVDRLQHLVDDSKDFSNIRSNSSFVGCSPYVRFKWAI